jgi:hypothetical protein
MPKTETDKIRDYARKVWPKMTTEEIEDTVDELVSNGYTTLHAVKQIKSDEHLKLYGGKLPMRCRDLIPHNLKIK